MKIETIKHHSTSLRLFAPPFFLAISILVAGVSRVTAPRLYIHQRGSRQRQLVGFGKLGRQWRSYQFYKRLGVVLF